MMEPIQIQAIKTVATSGAKTLGKAMLYLIAFILFTGSAAIISMLCIDHTTIACIILGTTVLVAFWLWAYDDYQYNVYLLHKSHIDTLEAKFDIEEAEKLAQLRKAGKLKPQDNGYYGY
jgi:hypothetical protein